MYRCPFCGKVFLESDEKWKHIWKEHEYEVKKILGVIE